MTTTIDKLIYDSLVARRSVVLPGVGLLEINRMKARKISDTQIVPPASVPVFTPDELDGGESIISLMANAEGTGEDEALALYGSWLDSVSRSDGSIAIDGVGTIGAGDFVVAAGLYNELNPTNQEIVTMEPEKKSSLPLWAWITIGILAAIVVFGAIWCCHKGMFGRSPVAEPVEAAVVSMPEPSADEVAAREAAERAAAAQAAAAKPTGPLWHVIAGAFAIESNADNFMAKIKREHPELTPVKLVYPSNGYNMVSIYQATSEREAYNKMNLYWDIDLYLWIYKQ